MLPGTVAVSAGCTLAVRLSHASARLRGAGYFKCSTRIHGGGIFCNARQWLHLKMFIKDSSGFRTHFGHPRR